MLAVCVGVFSTPQTVDAKKLKGNLHWPTVGELSTSYHLLFHRGVDFTVMPAAPVHAAAKGKVVKVKRSKRADRPSSVVIQHRNKVTTKYVSIKQMTVKKGQKVKRGEVLGYTGLDRNEIGSGHSTGPHLHFEVKKRGEHVNPRRWFKRRR